MDKMPLQRWAWIGQNGDGLGWGWTGLPGWGWAGMDRISGMGMGKGRNGISSDRSGYGWVGWRGWTGLLRWGLAGIGRDGDGL